MTSQVGAGSRTEADASRASSIARVAVIGTGVIGASWAALFLARGLEVAAWDPRPEGEALLRAAVARAWPAMEAMGLAPGAAPERLGLAASPEEAASGAGFVQENAPEDLDLKRDLFRRLDEAAPEGAILASSTSTFPVSAFQDACARDPGRVVLGHPFNPPHLIPLVEVCGGQATAPETVARAVAFYRWLGKRPIVLRREVRGHVANRLQAALWREAFHLVASGVADVADIDTAIAEGPGLRWALAGPFAHLSLAGGDEGIAGLFAKPLWQATEAMWRDLGEEASVDPVLARQIAEALAGEDRDDLSRRRDAALIALLRLKAQTMARS